MTGRRFVDTSIWVYGVDRDEPDKRSRARALIAAGGNDLVVSAQVLGEFYVTITSRLRRRVPPERAAVIVAGMSRLAVVPLDATLVAAAIAGSREWGISYWDAMIVSAAHTGRCGIVLTEDLQHGRTYGGVRAENPFLDAPAG